MNATTTTAVDRKSSAPSTSSQRLLALDALRGFDMFWIVGAEEIVHALNKASQTGITGFLSGQLNHKDWAGLAFYDLIFPLFVFIAGVSLVFSLTRSIEQNGRAGTAKKIIFRAALLYLVGILYYGGIANGVEKIRLLGVLQRIALAYLFGGLLFVQFRLKGLVVAFVSILVGYWALLTFVPVPGVGAGNFAEGKNLTNYLDKMYLPFRKWDGDHDPEGMLSTLPAVGTCLLGIFAGLWLRASGYSQQKKVLGLLAAGAASVLIGFLWGLEFPIIKKLWTSSFVLAAGGFACIFLALFYQVIEIWNFRGWSMPFVWIGMNPITIYLGTSLVDFGKLANRFVGGPLKSALGDYGEFLVAALAMLFVFLVARFLYQRKVFLRL